MSKLKAEPVLMKRSNISFDDLNKGQQKAFQEFKDWYYSKKRTKQDMIFRLGAVSGTGKSFMIRYILQEMKFRQDECYVAAYTGQAVNVLRQRDIMAKTIHSTFMHAREEPLRDKHGNIIYRSGIPTLITRFVPLTKLPNSVKLIIVDEASFISEDIEKLISRYNVPIFEVGDPLQLPPVVGTQCFTMSNIDITLDEVMRQNADSEIIQLATAIRKYEPIDRRMFWNDVRFIWAKETDEETFFHYKPFFKYSDVILTTTNKQRTVITDLYRKHIIGTDSPFPIQGEKMICRKNDWNVTLGGFPLTNGTRGTAVYTVGPSDVISSNNSYIMSFQPDFISNEYYENLLCDSKFLRAPFGNKMDNDYSIKVNPAKKFEYAYAITVNLDQGAEHNQVMFIDRWNKDAEYHMRQRYTAITRAKKRFYWVLPLLHGQCYTDVWKGGFKPV